MAVTVDLAAVEHAEHELEAARLAVRRLREKALVASGWKVGKDPKYADEKFWRDHIFYWPPRPIVGRRGKLRRRYRTLSEAFVQFRNQARRACGPLSCERSPRKR